MIFDVLSLGPARMDVFIQLPEDEVEEECSIDRKKCTISLGFGDKIAIKGLQFAVGGNTGNNAVGISRLGLKAAMVGTMGHGWADQRALEILKSEGVDTVNICTDSKQDGFGVVLNYQEERTILSYYPDAECGFPENLQAQVRWMYVTTAGEHFEEFYGKALDWALANHVQIAFNPGSRQIKAGLEKIKPVLSNSSLLFVNREEAARLLATTVSDIRGLLRGLAYQGAKTVVITDGPGGTYCFDGQRILHMPIINAPVIERTGAGDAFGSAFMAAVMNNKSLEDALRWGTVNSASVLGFVGPQDGLLSIDKMPHWLERTRDVRVEEL
jgi:sugar/nucleoside kinase (ribokinase family)